MRKKIFTFLLALTASIGMMWAETVVVINKSEFTSSGVTKEGVTLALSSGSMNSNETLAMNGSFEFSTSLGKFTGITIATDINIMQIYENAYTSAGWWPTGLEVGKSAVWTGESETVLISCMVAGDNITITCTIEEPTPNPTSGSCGDNLTWEFNTETGALTISGTGAMTSAPWETYYKEDITSLSLPDGLTAIPSEAFKGCTGLTTVTIPASVTSIEADAFLGCESVTDVYCYPKAADLDWNDYYTDDFIEYPAAETRCHVFADEYLEYIARYSQGDGVNVTFMNDLEAVAVTTNEDPHNSDVYYSTFYHGTKKYRLPNDGTEAYVADLSGSDLRLTKIAEGNDVLPNGVAVILKASSNNITLTPSDAAAVAVTAANSLQGVDAETTAPENTYVLSGTEQHGVGFYRINSENLKAHKAYVIYSGSNAPKRMRFVFNQEQTATGIDNASADIKAEKRIENGVLYIIKNGVRYNVQGQIVK